MEDIMIWGNFGVAHIISLITAALIIFCLYLILMKLTQKAQIIILGILSFAGIAAIIYNLVAWDSPFEYLPFHLCSINAILLPVTVFTRNKTLGNLLLFWSLGAFLALVINNAMAEAQILSLPFAFYYFPHVLEFGIPILLFRLKLVEKDFKCLTSTLSITLGIFTLVHFINLGLNSYLYENNITNPAGNLIQVNYMYTIIPENPLLALFYSIIPYPYLYLLLALPIIAIYLLVIYLPQIIKQRKYRKSEE